MTIASETSSAGPYAGDDTTDNFSFAFKVFTSADIAVVLTSSAGVDTTLTITTHYTVSLNADQEASPGGSVTLLTPPATGENLTILRDMTLTQGAALPNQGGWYPEVVEDALDKLTMITQQLEEKIDRAIVVGVTGNPDTYLEDTQAAATAAAASQAAAAASAAAALVSEGAAAASEIAAAASAGTAAASEAVVVALQPDIQTCATNIAAIIAAPTEASNAASSASAAAASYDSFDDRYLGAKAADPTLDNDGNALLTGALYWNTGSSEMRVYSGSAWVAAYVPGTTYVTGAASSVDSEIALFSGTGGKTIKRASTTGLLKAASGVLSAASAGTDYSVPTGSETLTNKTMAALTNNVEARSGPDSSAFTFRNKIIGGDFTVNPWQRGTSFTAPATGSYLADRFYVGHSSDAVFNILKTADAPTVAEAGVYTAHCFHLDVTTADASIAAGQRVQIIHAIEGLNAASFGFGQAGTRYVTLSFWHKHTKTGTYCVTLQSSSGPRYYVAEYTQDVTDTWEKATLTIPVDTSGTWAYDNTAGITLYFIVAMGSTYHGTAATWGTGDIRSSANQVNALDSTSNNFKLALIQLEAGQTATPFESRPYGTELALCQRYYYRIFPAANNETFGSGGNFSTTQAAYFIKFPVSMRTSPTALETNGTPSHYQMANYGGTNQAASVGPTFNEANTDGATVVVQCASGLITSAVSDLRTSATTGTTAYLGWSAEL